jgi:hypothetical protein
VGWCRDYKCDILLFGNEGWSLDLHKYQEKLAYSPWMINMSDECLLMCNYFALILMQYPSYAINETLVVPDIKLLFGHPSLEQAKYLHDYFFPASSTIVRDLDLNEDDEKATRPDVVKLIIKVVPALEKLGLLFNFRNFGQFEGLFRQVINNQGICSTLKQFVDVIDIDVVASSPNENMVNFLGSIFTSFAVGNDELKIEDNDELDID